MSNYRYEYFDVEIMEDEQQSRGPGAKKRRIDYAIDQAREMAPTWVVPAAWYPVWEKRTSFGWRLRIGRKSRRSA